jgi:phosphatidylglycerophosphate synthase
MPNVVHPADMVWVLRLVEPAAASSVKLDRAVAGLSCPLRLALSAQSGRAAYIELASDAETRRPLLRDPRLKLAVASAGAGQPEPDLVIEAPCNLVVHRDLLSVMACASLRGVHRLPEQATPLDRPFGFDPILVVDDATARNAERALLRSLRKVQDGWTSTYLNRYISLALTRWLVRTPLRPNQVSVGILAVGLVGAYLASRGTYLSMLVGAFLFQTQSVLDGCDGEMSRVTYRGSHLGEWMDTVGDDLTNYGFFAGTAWGLYSATGSWGYLLAGAITVACGLVASGIEYRYLYRIGSGDLLRYPLGVGSAPTTSGISKGSLAKAVDGIAPVFKRDTFVFMTLIGAAAGLLGPFLVMFAMAAVGILVAVIKAEIRMAGESRSAP